MATETDLRQACLSLPEVMEKSFDRLPGFYVKKKLFARISDHPGAIVVWRPDVAEKEALIAAEPEKFFETSHYSGHPAVLVRLKAVGVCELRELVTESWTLRAPPRLVARFNEGER